MQNKKEIFLLVLLGVAAGLFLAFYAAGLFILFLLLCSLLFMKVFIKTGSSGFLIKLFIISFILRAILCVVNYNVGLKYPFSGGDTQPDASVYSSNAFYVAHVLNERPLDESLAMSGDPHLALALRNAEYCYKGKLPPVQQYQFGPYVFLLGVFYAWLGYAPIAAKMLNSLFCCISIVVVYLISRQLFKEERPARISSVIFAFFPSIFYWSVTALRDSLCGLLILSYLLCLIKFITGKKIKYILWSLLFIYFFDFFRGSISSALLAGIGVALILVLLKAYKARKDPVLRILLVSGIYFALVFLLLNRAVIMSKVVNAADFLAHINVAHITINGTQQLSDTNYRVYSDVVYQKGKLSAGDVFSLEYLATIFKAIVYFLFTPFPLGKWTLNFLPFYPQTIYWFLMFLFAIKGWLLFLKKDMFDGLTLAALFLILVIPTALYESNIGTAFRHKDMFIPVAFMFAAYAFTRRKAA